MADVALTWRERCVWWRVAHVAHVALSGREMCVVEGGSHGSRGSELERCVWSRVAHGAHVAQSWRERCVWWRVAHVAHVAPSWREMCVVKGGSRGSELERDVCGGGWLTWL